MSEYATEETDEAGLLEELHGKRNTSFTKRLNKSRLNTHEMDEIFMEE